MHARRGLREPARSTTIAIRCSDTLATFDLIATDELDAACEHCGALIDVARPRGWRIALAHGSFLRAIALVRAGWIRDAEADARLALRLQAAP